MVQTVDGIEVAHRAEADLAKLIAYYLPRTGASIVDMLFAELDRAFVRLRQNPKMAPVVRGQTRRFMLERFPINVLYRVEADRIVILRLPHQRQRPQH